MLTTPDPAVAAWNAAHPKGTLIQWRRTAEADFTNTGKTWTDAILVKGVPSVRVTARYFVPLSNGDFVPLSNVRLHPAAAQIAELGKVEVENLYFPPPDCEFCDVDTYHDGDGFRCPQCLARWSSNGRDGTRRCVECPDAEADVVGADKQPRCLPCAADVLAGVLEATAPYQCRRCGDEVVGIGIEHGELHARRLCGGCNHANERAAS